jgi:hypothetical protein
LYKAVGVRGGQQPVEVAIGLEDTNSSRDNKWQEVHQEGDITVGKVVGHRECIKVWAWKVVNGLANNIKKNCDGISS